MTDIRAFRERAAAVAQRINEQSEIITGRLREAEEEIGAWSLGVSVFIEDPPLEMQLAEGGTSLRTEELGYAKIGGRWCLAARSSVSGEQPSYRKVRTLTECSPDLRIAAVDLLPVLMEKLLDAAEARVHEVEGKAGQLESLVGELKA